MQVLQYQVGPKAVLGIKRQWSPDENELKPFYNKS